MTMPWIMDALSFSKCFIISRNKMMVALDDVSAADVAAVVVAAVVVAAVDAVDAAGQQNLLVLDIALLWCCRA